MKRENPPYSCMNKSSHFKNILEKAANATVLKYRLNYFRVRRASLLNYNEIDMQRRDDKLPRSQ